MNRNRNPEPALGTQAALAGVRDRTRTRFLLGVLLLAGVLGGAFVWDYAVQKNFEVVVPGKVYRSGQPGPAQLEHWIKEYRLKSIVSLRHALPAYEQELADRHGVRLYHFTFSAKTGLPEPEWEQIRNVLVHPNNLPVLVHCQSGVDRTGLVVALYRIEEQGWPLDKALREMILNYHLPFQYPRLQQEVRDRFDKERVQGTPDTREGAPWTSGTQEGAPGTPAAGQSAPGSPAALAVN